MTRPVKKKKTVVKQDTAAALAKKAGQLTRVLDKAREILSITEGGCVADC